MKKLSHEKDISVIARQLGLEWQHDPIQAIVRYCTWKIQEWISGAPKSCSISAIQEIVCSRLHLVFEEIWSDRDLVALVRKYTNRGQHAFAYLPRDLTDTTYATLMRLSRVGVHTHDNYVAVIDCRGPKATRRFFSRWHEIAHLLTRHDQLEFPFHRSVRNGNAQERLMDHIAGHLGFFDALFRPALEAELVGGRYLSFRAVQNIRERFCPEASFQATLIACVERVIEPVIYLEAGMGYKKAEIARLRRRRSSLSRARMPQPALRALVVAPNTAARQVGFAIHYNMQVPEQSIISRLFSGDTSLRDGTHAIAREDLGAWRHSDGTSLEHIETRIEARRFGDRIVCLLMPAHPQPDPVTPESGPLWVYASTSSSSS